jgi:superfamily II DNA helicase RecQ
MALTATANAKVRTDVINKLGIAGCVQLVQSFNRPNLHYEVRKKDKNVVSDIATYIRAHHHKQTGVIYCLSRNKCEEVAMQLREKNNINARHYHAAMTVKDKSETQAAWNSGECEVIVATVSRLTWF